MRKLFIIPVVVVTFWSCENNATEADRLEWEMESVAHEDDTVLSDSVLANINDSALVRTMSKISLMNFEDSLTKLYNAIELKKYNLPYKVFRHGMIGFFSLKQEGRLNDKNLISIIDFTQTSCDKRFYTIDLDKKKLLFNTLVSHGRNTGGNEATSFSNRRGSNQSSLGFYVTAETYFGSKGYSMRLDGVEEGVNDKMRDRAVVMHDAPYVSDDWIKKYGRIGRSQGCPALPKQISKKVIDKIKDRTAIFAYYNDDEYLKASDYINLDKLMAMKTLNAQKSSYDSLKLDPTL